MKNTRKLYITIASFVGLALVLIGAYFYTGRADAQQETKIPKVGVLQLMSHPALDQINKGIDDTLKSNGYINGKNVKIEFQNAQGDQSNLRTISKKFVQDNVTGVAGTAPIKDQLTLMEQVIPNLKSIGIIYTSSDSPAATQVKQMQKFAQKDGISVKVSTISGINDLEQVATDLTGKVQTIYVPTDNTVASGMKLLSSIAAKKDMAVFPAATTMVKDGGLATNGISQYELGVKTGEHVVKVLQGKEDPATTPVTNVNKGHIMLNEKVAKKLNIKFPDSLIKEAQEHGEIIK